MDSPISSTSREPPSATTQYGEALQTVEALRAAITESPTGSLNALRANVDRMIDAEAQLEASRLEVQSLSTDITSLQAQISLLTAVQPESAPPAVPLSPNTNMFSHPPATMAHRSAKLADPDKFSGKQADLPNFLAQLQLKLQANADHWPDETAKIAYCISWLEGDALRNLPSAIRQEPIPGTNTPRIVIDFSCTSALIARLQTSFGDPDPTGTARMELSKLHQGKQDFSSYLSEFTRIMSVLNYDPAAKMDALEGGMSQKLREGLVYNIRPAPSPENYDAWCHTLLQLDNRMRQLEAQKMGAYTPTSQVSAAVSYAQPAAYSNNYDAMDLSYSGVRQSGGSAACPAQHLRYETDANGRRHVSALEKAWRRASGRPDYCAGEHRQVACLVKIRGSSPGSRALPGMTSNNPFRVQAAELTPRRAGLTSAPLLSEPAHEQGFPSSLD